LVSKNLSVILKSVSLFSVPMSAITVGAKRHGLLVQQKKRNGSSFAFTKTAAIFQLRVPRVRLHPRLPLSVRCSLCHRCGFFRRAQIWVIAMGHLYTDKTPSLLAIEEPSWKKPVPASARCELRVRCHRILLNRAATLGLSSAGFRRGSWVVSSEIQRIGRVGVSMGRTRRAGGRSSESGRKRAREGSLRNPPTESCKTPNEFTSCELIFIDFRGFPLRFAVFS
jgi:hypothetical protein